ncbi:hypothetical protein [Paenibacillus sp. Leaf72]|uniref:hypothetical protein n=1 Tax=Paenibacillus sp. Leaf72 TaxID=1736234 RepID=UPI003FA68564
MVKNRTLVPGQKVRVYLNLNMMGRFSIQDFKTGLVVAYAESVLLNEVEFRVRKSGQEKARKEKCRNVHAFAIGSFVSSNHDCPLELSSTGYYNPFKVDHFVDEESHLPIFETENVFCFQKRVYYKKEEGLF